MEGSITERESKFLDRLLDLLHWDEALVDGALTRPDKAKKELNGAIAELKKFLKGPLKNKKFTHPCGFGCCSGVEETRQRLVSVLLTLFVFRRPSVPALNKWTKLFPALSYWCVATNLFNIIGLLWEMVFTEKKLRSKGQILGRPKWT